MPVSLVIPNALAVRADRQQSAQGLDLCQRLLQLVNETDPFLFQLLAAGDLPQHHDVCRDAAAPFTQWRDAQIEVPSVRPIPQAVLHGRIRIILDRRQQVGDVGQNRANWLSDHIPDAQSVEITDFSWWAAGADGAQSRESVQQFTAQVYGARSSYACATENCQKSSIPQSVNAILEKLLSPAIFVSPTDNRSLVNLPGRRLPSVRVLLATWKAA